MMTRTLAFVASLTVCSALVHLSCPKFWTAAHVRALTNRQFADAFDRERLLRY